MTLETHFGDSDGAGSVRETTPWDEQLPSLLENLSAAGQELPARFAQMLARDIKREAETRAAHYRALCGRRRGAYVRDALHAHKDAFVEGVLYGHTDVCDLIGIGTPSGVCRALFALQQELDVYAVEPCDHTFVGTRWMRPEQRGGVLSLPARPPRVYRETQCHEAYAFLRETVLELGYTPLQNTRWFSFPCVPLPAQLSAFIAHFIDQGNLSVGKINDQMCIAYDARQLRDRFAARQTMYQNRTLREYLKRNRR